MRKENGINISKETLVTNKYFSSGLYRKPFYREHHFDINELCSNIDELRYNRELLLKEWKGEEIDDNEEDEESLFEIVLVSIIHRDSHSAFRERKMQSKGFFNLAYS